jgi:hypothetical protein
LQARPKILKRSSEQQNKSTNQNENFPNKSMFNTFEKEKKTKIHIGSIRQTLQARLKVLKNDRNMFSKNVCLVHQKCKGAKNCIGATHRNFQARPKILKKTSQRQINYQN